MTKPGGDIRQKSIFILGLDIARYGKDKTVYTVLEKPFDEEIYYVVLIFETEHKPLTDVIHRVKFLDNKFHFKKIYIDETGHGAGVVDALKEAVGNKIEGITFTMKSKMDLYSNLRKLMSQGKLKIPRHKKLIFELMDLKKEIAENERDIKIHHSEKGFDDYCFIGDTLILTDKGQIPIKKIKVGDVVLTRKGYKKVISIGNRFDYVINKLGLVGTKEHPIITTKGIKSFININVSDKIYIWNEKQSSIMEYLIIDTQILKEGIYVSTIGVTQNIFLRLFIDKYGKINLVKFLKDMLFIIKMKIHLITKLKIWRLCQGENINHNIVKQRNENKNLGRHLINMQDPRQLNGINQMKEENGIKYIGKNTWEKNLKKRKVYNISVEGCNEYFANNILVHNCDSLALACWFFKEEKRYRPGFASL